MWHETRYQKSIQIHVYLLTYLGVGCVVVQRMLARYSFMLGQRAAAPSQKNSSFFKCDMKQGIGKLYKSTFTYLLTWETWLYFTVFLQRMLAKPDMMHVINVDAAAAVSTYPSLYQQLVHRCVATSQLLHSMNTIVSFLLDVLAFYPTIPCLEKRWHIIFDHNSRISQ